MRKQGKIYLEGDTYTYDFHTDGTFSPLQANFRTEFYNDTLCSLSLIFDSKYSDYPTLIENDVERVFKKHATGYKYFIEKPKYEWDSHHKYYIKNNLIVEFSSTFKAVMKYVNAPKCKLLEEQEKQSEIDKVNSTISDF